MHNIWLHEKALHNKYEDARAIFIWDDAYFQNRQYSLKKLVFIYESIRACDNLTILYGDTVCILNLFKTGVYIPATPDSYINAIIQRLSIPYTLVHAPPFVELPESFRPTRFFKYWSKAKKTAFLA